MACYHGHTHLIVFAHVCGYYSRAATISFAELQVQLLIEGGLYSRKYGIWDTCRNGKSIPYTVGGIITVTFPSRPVPFKRKRVPIPFNKKQKLNGRWSMRQMVRPTFQTVASSKNTQEESKKAERRTTSVDLLVVNAI